jgi:hypothetical protein
MRSRKGIQVKSCILKRRKSGHKSPMKSFMEEMRFKVDLGRLIRKGGERNS